jgi:hypothetical protein
LTHRRRREVLAMRVPVRLRRNTSDFQGYYGSVITKCENPAI